MKKSKFNYKLIIAIVVLVVAVSLIIFFAIKSSKSSDNKDKDNFNLLFEQYSNDILISKLDVEFKDNKVNDVVITFVYDNASVAKEISKIYKDEDEFVDIVVEGKNVIMHYGEKDIKEISNFTKDEIIERYKLQGYEYIK